MQTIAEDRKTNLQTYFLKNLIDFKTSTPQIPHFTDTAMSKNVSSIGAKLQRTFSSQVTRVEAGQHCAHLEKFIESTHAFNGIHKYPYLAI